VWSLNLGTAHSHALGAVSPMWGMKGEAMKGKAIIPLAIGLAVGVVAIKLFVDIVKRAKGSTPAAATVPIVTAAAEIPQGVSITKNMLTVKQIPQSLAPSQQFAKPEDVIDRVTSMMIPKDMPVLGTMLAPKGTAPGLVARIPEGMRAVAVKVDEWVGVGGWLKPGVRVDVAAVFTVGSGGKSETISKIILQNIEVIAVGGEKGQTPQDTGPMVARSVTLLVKTTDVGKLHLASEKGKIRLAMRNSLDEKDQEIAADSEKALYGLGNSPVSQPAVETVEPEPEPVQVAQVHPWYLDLSNGKKRERLVFRDKDSMEEFRDDEGGMRNDAANMPARKTAGQPPRKSGADSGDRSIDYEFGE